MSFTGSGGAVLPPSRIRALLQALQVAAPDEPAGAEAQPGGRRGLIGSGYQTYMARAGGASAPAGNDLFGAAQGGPHHQGVQYAQNTRAPSRPVDPRRDDVFRPGPDGKLHPIPGWRTTGPFDFGQWADNVNWKGVGHDLGKIALEAPLWFLMGPTMTAKEGLGLGLGFGSMLQDTLDDINSKRSAK